MRLMILCLNILNIVFKLGEPPMILDFVHGLLHLVCTELG